MLFRSVWYLLAKHPDVQARVGEEIGEVLNGRLPTGQDVPKLRHTEMVLKETLRLYPPAVGTFARQANADVEIGGYTIRKGGIVRLLSYPLHHDPRWFADPERFDPERFAPGRAEQIPQYAYFPFGGGPRVCVGNQFAMMEMTLILATILPRFRLELPPGQPEPELSVTMSLRPKGGLQMTVNERVPAALAGAHA